MKRIVTGCLALLTSIASFGQADVKDPKAKGILDQLSKKTNAYTSIHATFDHSLKNESEGLDEVNEGELWLEGNKFRVKLVGQDIRCNGTTQWNFIEDDEEVTVEDYEPEGEDAMMSPANIFTMYESGFKYQYVGQMKKAGKEADVIKLFPEKADKFFHTAVLYIDHEKLEIMSIELKGKDGNNYAYAIKSFETNASFPKSTFQWVASENPDIDVIDLR